MVSNYHGVYYRLANHYLGEANKLKALQTPDSTRTIPIEPQEVNQADIDHNMGRAKELMEVAEKNFPYKVATARSLYPGAQRHHV